MSRQPEPRRRKDYCLECKNFKPIKAKGMCQNCWHKYKRKNDPEFFLRTRYTEVKQRCTNPNGTNHDIYLGKKFCSLNEFLLKFLNDENFLNLFKEWGLNGYKINHCPSIDRIDNAGDYTIENIQIITHLENSLKDRVMTPVNVFDKQGNLKYKFESQGETARSLNIPQANIWKVLNKERKTAGGYYFEYA